MNKGHTEYLFKNFPFFRPEVPLTESLMAFGFECGDGWFDLIKKLCEKLNALNLKNFRVIQVKEKFGGLRFYIGPVKTKKADKVFRLIDKATEKSYRTCEACGRPGKPNKEGWIKTLCNNCRRTQ